jgi:hypothetical protein
MAAPAIIPFLPLIGAGIGAGANVAGGYMSSKAQERINKRNIQHSQQTIAQQREWALSDWDKVNAYNHPHQQMARYKEAGLSPHLIYGSATSQPASQIARTTQEAPKEDASGFIQGARQMAQAGPEAFNTYFSMKQLENQSAVSAAQVLKMKSETDRNEQQFKLTGEQWNDLVNGPLFRNLKTASDMYYTDAKRNATPTQSMVLEKHLADLAKTNATAKHALQLYELAIQEGKLKQADIDLLEKIGTGNTGLRTFIELLKLILK